MIRRVGRLVLFSGRTRCPPLLPRFGGCQQSFAHNFTTAATDKPDLDSVPKMEDLEVDDSSLEILENEDSDTQDSLWDFLNFSKLLQRVVFNTNVANQHGNEKFNYDTFVVGARRAYRVLHKLVFERNLLLLKQISTPELYQHFTELFSTESNQHKRMKIDVMNLSVPLVQVRSAELSSRFKELRDSGKNLVEISEELQKLTDRGTKFEFVIKFDHDVLLRDSEELEGAESKHTQHSATILLIGTLGRRTEEDDELIDPDFRIAEIYGFDICGDPEFNFP